jgi:hypothetical protein
MPPQDCLRLNHLGRTKKAPPERGHPYEQRPVTAAQSKTRRCPPQSDGELMAEKQILGLKPPSRLEQINDERSECLQDSLSSNSVVKLWLCTHPDLSEK